MSWTVYEIFSVVSGLILVGGGLFLRHDDFRGKDRFMAVVGGVFLVGYGFYVANQTSGTWKFPVIIFALPIALGILLIRRIAKGEQTEAPSPPRPAPAPQYGSAPHYGQAHEPAAGPNILRDGAVVRALETYGRRELAGADPWTPETAVLVPLRDGIAAAQGTPGAALFLQELQRIAPLSPGHGVGVWRFVARHGPLTWRKTGLPVVFLDSLKQIMRDPAGPPIAYRLDDFESDEVRRREPQDSPLWKLVTPRVTDLIKQEPPAIGAEPSVIDLADGEQRLLATIGANQILCYRTPTGGYVAKLFRSNPEPWVAATETYAESDSLIGLLRATGERIGSNVANLVASEDLAPYLAYRRPAWWPEPDEPRSPGHVAAPPTTAAVSTAPATPPYSLAAPPPAPPAHMGPAPAAPAPATGGPASPWARAPSGQEHRPVPVQRVARSAAEWDQLIGGVLHNTAVVRALEAFARRQLAGEAPWTTETEPLTRLRDVVAAAQGTGYATRLVDGLTRIAETDPWYAVGAWLFVSRYGLPAWRNSPLRTLFLDALTRLMADPTVPPIAYRFDDFESDLVRNQERPDSPLWRLMPQ